LPAGDDAEPARTARGQRHLVSLLGRLVGRPRRQRHRRGLSGGARAHQGRTAAPGRSLGERRRRGQRQHLRRDRPLDRKRLMSTRPSGRAPDELRAVRFTRSFTRHAEGSVLVEFGNTQVLCTATVEEGVPGFLRGKGQGWVTAEYGMLPRATHTRSPREAAKGKQSGRTQEIQRLIGRSLRAITNMAALGERTITLDCDVLQADGGTRTAAITGSYVALADACDMLVAKRMIGSSPLHGQVAAISVGICNGMPVIDLDYAEDSTAETDMNVVMNNGGGFIEVQGTAEGHAFRRHELDALLNLAAEGIAKLFEMQAG